MWPDDIEVSDKGSVFDKVHVDNTPLEKTFEDLFVETYGNDALGFLQKYSVSLSNGRNAFVDYVVETSTGSYAIEENGVHYHLHPQLIRLEAYKR